MNKRPMQKRIWHNLSIGVLLVLGIAPFAESQKAKTPKNNPQQLRTDYIARLQELDVHTVTETTVGSLWSQSNMLGDLSTDYKAHKVNDTIVIVVAVQTTPICSVTAASPDINGTGSKKHIYCGQRLRASRLPSRVATASAMNTKSNLAISAVCASLVK